MPDLDAVVRLRPGVRLMSGTFDSWEEHTQFRRHDDWLAWGERNNWVSLWVPGENGYDEKVEWTQCAWCKRWFFYNFHAQDARYQVGNTYTCRVGDNPFFCGQCQDMDVDEKCGTCCCIVITTPTAVLDQRECDEDGVWHCAECWDEYQYGEEEADDEGEDEGEEYETEGEEYEAEGEGEEEGAWCSKCDTFFPNEYPDFGWQPFVCEECAEELAPTAAAYTSAALSEDTAAMSKHEKNMADVEIVSQATVVQRLGLCPFYVYWTHVRGRPDSCDGRCGLVHDNPGSATLGELLFADPPKLYCCSGSDPPCLRTDNLVQATGFSTAAEWVSSLPWCALPLRHPPIPLPSRLRLRPCR